MPAACCPISIPSEPAAGGVMISTEGRALPLLGTSLRAQAQNGVARVVLEQRFRNVYDVPLQVTYSFPLPADGAVSGFAFRLGERRIVGEVDRQAAARERFEEAILEGKSAALLEQDRSSLFTQELGNIPPGAEIVAEISIDQRLRWLPDGAWEWRFPTAVGPRYMGAPGRVPDAARLSPEVCAEPLAARLTLALDVRDTLAAGRTPESPSHALNVAELAEIRLRESSGVPLDRDVVVRWAVGGDGVGATIETARRPEASRLAASAYGLLTLVPPRSSHEHVARDVVVLLDTSGSMGGEPLAQACRVLSALVETLGERDRLEMIEFSSAAQRWKRQPMAVTAAVRREALRWLATRSAGGSTEMRDAIIEALRARRTESQRQVILVTDGFIGFETQVVDAIARRGATARVHTVGVGSAVNRSLTSAAARAGGGLELIVGLGEDAEPAARRIVAASNAPIVVDLELTGSAFVAHAGLPDLFLGMPASIPLELRPGGGELLVRGRTAHGRWEQRLTIGAIPHGSGRDAVVTLFGRERVEDLEARLGSGESNIDPQIEQVGVDFQIATRLTSWVAVSELVTVDPQSPIRRERMPQQLPHGVSAEGVGLRPAAASLARFGAAGAPAAMSATMSAAMPAAKPAAVRSAAPDGMRRYRLGAPPAPPAPVAPAPKGKLGETLARGVRSIFGQRPPSAPPPPPEAAPSAAPPREPELVFEVEAGGAGAGSESERSLRGRVARRTERELVFELEIDEHELGWVPPLAVEVAWSDGTSAELEVLADRTTRAGTFRSGERVRLVVAIGPSDIGRKPSQLRLAQPKGSLRVLL